MHTLFDYRAGSPALHIKYAKGEPSTKNQEFHYYHEFVLFLDGSAYFISKDIQQQLPPGSIVIIPKEQFHQFRVTSPEQYTRFILGFSDHPELMPLIDDVMTQIKVISTPGKNIQNIYSNLIKFAQSALPEEEKLLFVKSSLMQLLLYFKYDQQEQVHQNINISPLVQQAILYIDQNYPQKITTERIAKALYTSPSSLAHKFSTELGISIYRYISKKRLLEVHKLVEQGQSLTTAVAKCGFNDYSCYYRIYKKYANSDAKHSFETL
ncbi:MAG: helix-turn-helix domain-containing protein [Oscillospiraceae bacterium]|nr:helix-turn-helix domain-containing protein [Oscillospiraceae bacterium]